MKKLMLLVPLLTILLVGFCKKKEEQIDQYQEVCKKIAECDKTLVQIGNLEQHCSKFLQSVEKQKPGLVSPIVECIKNTGCEELRFANCVEKNIKELQGLIPGK